MSEIQRYRVNYRLLFSLIVGGCISAVAAYFLWRFQVDRNANRLLERAKAAQAESDDQEAYDTLTQYVRLRPDENEARVRLGMAAAKLLERDDLDLPTQSDAYHTLGEAVIRTGDIPLRRKLVDFYMTHGAADRALQPIDELLAAGQQDAELKVMRAKCLFASQRSAEAANYCFKLIGYNQKSGEFDAKAEVADQPEVYAYLAQYLYGDRKQDLAKQVIAQMIAANPKSRDAYIAQYQFLKRSDEANAQAPLETAYKLDPTDATVLLFKGLEELSDYQTKLGEATADTLAEVRKEAEKHLDEAAKYFAQGLQEHPDRIAFYEYAARVELARDRIPEAVAIIDRGLKKFDLKSKLGMGGIPQAIELVTFKIDLYLGKNDIDNVRREIKALRDLHNSKVDPLADYQEARIELQNNNWMEAARKMADVKVRLINYPPLQAMAGATEGVCYAQLGQYDLALQAYDWALEKNPSLPQALAGKEEMQRMVGQDARQADPLQMDAAVKDMLALPKEKQNWDLLTAKIDEYVDKQAQMKAVDQAWLSAQNSSCGRSFLRPVRWASTTRRRRPNSLKRLATPLPRPTGSIPRTLPCRAGAAALGLGTQERAHQGDRSARRHCQEERRFAQLPHAPHRPVVDAPRRKFHQSRLRRHRRHGKMDARAASAGVVVRRHAVRTVRPISRRSNLRQQSRGAGAQHTTVSRLAVSAGAQARR